MRSRPFGNLPSGESVELWTLAGSGGANLEFLTYGGIVTSLMVPDRNGTIADIVLGFDRLEPYLTGHPYFGAITGRVAGRIPGARFTLDGKTYELAKNDGPNHLHGGLCGLDKRIWKAEQIVRADGADSIRLVYHSPDGEEGYPGAVDFSVTYTFTRDNVFLIESEAVSDRLTPVSLTHHSYFNLAGKGSILNHELEVFSDRAFVVDEILTPLGQSRPVAGSVSDFNSPRRLGDVIPHLFEGHGECYQLPGGDYLAARVYDPASGRTLAVSTDEFCLQIYTSSKLDCASPGKSGRPYPPYSGLCLECEGYPGGVDYPEFGSILVEPGRPMRRTTRYAFSTQ
ncbi:MAG: galactose mutarotase [Verrucomicrobiaceae bacterium]|nr:MAG: galactose mutarotase [Verrucomicrobiaceae bacterium]